MIDFTQTVVPGTMLRVELGSAGLEVWVTADATDYTRLGILKQQELVVAIDTVTHESSWVRCITRFGVGHLDRRWLELA